MFIGRNRCKHLALTLITVVHAIFVHFQIFSVVFFCFLTATLHVFSSTTAAESNLVFL